jgi:hypothetical protein
MKELRNGYNIVGLSQVCLCSVQLHCIHAIDISFYDIGSPVLCFIITENRIHMGHACEHFSFIVFMTNTSIIVLWFI